MMSVCIHGNLCREIYNKTGYIHSRSCPNSCPHFEKKCKTVSVNVIEDMKLDIETEGAYYQEIGKEGKYSEAFLEVLAVIEKHINEENANE